MKTCIATDIMTLPLYYKIFLFTTVYNWNKLNTRR